MVVGNGQESRIEDLFFPKGYFLGIILSAESDVVFSLWPRKYLLLSNFFFFQNIMADYEHIRQIRMR